MTTELPTIAFIGLGIMGGPMAGHLLAAGHTVHLHSRTKSKATGQIDAGGIWHDDPAEAAAMADIVITMVGLPSDVEQLYLGEGGLLNRMRANGVLIDMTTSTPSLAVRIAAEAAARGLHALDAPVSGGPAGAQHAKLSIMVGGDAAIFSTVLPVLQVMGTNIVLQGGPGAGQHTKMSNQIVIAGNMLGVAEGLAYAAAAGLDPAKVLQSIGTGAAASFLLGALGPLILKGDFSPGFMIRHFVKDMTIACEESDQRGLDLKGLKTALAQYAALADAGHAQEGTQALAKAYGVSKSR
jgi:3-hydroxyisobutyrate dehydrogenase